MYNRRPPGHTPKMSSAIARGATAIEELIDKAVERAVMQEKRKCEDMERIIAALQSQLRASDREVQLQQEIEQWKTMCDTLERATSQKDSEIALLNSRLWESERKVKAYEKTLRHSQNKSESLEFLT
ncbi:unnamed protein product [Somion occarium]|uniref:Uncharacterized protein n=1 Tax=Somion occarium TaxID=3059160 RepID=A0ABP1DQP3_9APHY